MWTCPSCGREFSRIDQHHFCQAPTAIDDYIAERDEAVRPLLEQVRECIRAEAPDATEKISWSMPTFWQGENLIHFAAAKHHLGLYPGDLTEAPFAERLAGYHTSKGAIQLPYDKPIDFDLIRDIVRWRVERAKAKHPKAFATAE
ncbi:MAG: DUF1801 domain-containing protein [Propionibacteriaceae bacterium]|jgi:uncharacterized protein YdhG (YjbR/CyaY superfamily)|nr:DUF1801 domain-containing protein [Propionibacteriaceae bacterium]